MSAKERKSFLGKKHISPFAGLEQVATPHFHTAVKDLPSSVDWRAKGVVTPVKVYPRAPQHVLTNTCSCPPFFDEK
jgi:hypothetical protein